MPRPENPIQLAVIGAAHGTRGEVRVKTFTGDPLAIADYGLLYDEQGDLIELSEKGKRPMLIPFTEAAVPEIDFDKGILLVEPHAAGLIAEDEDERPQGEKKKPKK